MSQNTLLVELHNVDMRIDENHAVLAALEKKLADDSELTNARADWETSDRHAGELSGQLRALELETRGLEEKLKEVNARLYGGRITNPKELAGLNQDERMLARRKAELEDRELELMEAIETAVGAAAELKRALDSKTAGVTAANDHAKSELRERQAAIESLTRKRDAVRGQLPAPTIVTYDELRKTRKGRAVALIKGDSCAACGFTIPSGLVSRARLGNDIVFCGNCGRILAT